MQIVNFGYSIVPKNGFEWRELSSPNFFNQIQRLLLIAFETENPNSFLSVKTSVTMQYISMSRVLFQLFVGQID